MSIEETHEAVAEPIIEADQEETKPARRALLTALFGAAGLGAVGLALASPRAKIGPEAKPEPLPAPLQPGAASSVASGTVVAWVTWIGTAPNTTDVNLRALQPANSSVRMIAVALGFHTEGDGGGGVFEWDPSGGSDDGGTVIVYNASAPTVGSPTPATGACWRRIYSGPIDVRWFGAKCNAYDVSPTDDTDAFWRALSALRAGVQLNISGPMAVGATNGWTTPLHVTGKSDFSIVGLGANCGIRVMHYPGSQVGFPGIGPGQSFVISSCSRVQIRGVLFDGNGLNGALLGMAQVTDSLVADCVFIGSRATVNPALFTIACIGNIYRGNKFDDNDTGATIGFPSAYGGGGATLIEQGAVFTENTIANCTYVNGGAALWLCARESSVTNNTFSDNACGTINIFASGSHVPSHIVISENLIMGGAAHGIRADYNSITSHVSDVVISDNVFEDNYALATYLYQTDRVTITGNSIRNNGGSIGTNDAVNWLIASNSIIDTRETPIQGGISMNPIVGCVIANNIIDGVGGSYLNYSYGTAIALIGQNDNPAKNITISGNVIRNSNRGIYVIGHEVAITGNTIIDMVSNQYTGGTCVYLLGDSTSGGSGHLCTNVTVTGNLFSSDSSGCRVAVGTAYNVRLSENTFYGTAAYDVYHTAPSTGEVLFSNGDQFVNTVYTTSYVVEIHGKQKVMRASAAPTSTLVAWSVGDVVYNTAPASAGYIGWVCTAAGSPGTWKAFGLIT